MIDIRATPPIISSRETEESEAKVAAPKIIIKEARKKDK
jgi:hypothetical protein